MPIAAPQRIAFGTTAQATAHAFRHVDRLRMDRQAIVQAIIADLTPHLPLALAADGSPFQGSVVIARTRLTYHAFPLDNGIVNVGRITPPQVRIATPPSGR